MNIAVNSADLLKILDKSEELVFLLSDEYKFMWANKAYCHYMGIDQNKIESMQIRDIIPVEYVSTLEGKYAGISSENPIFTSIYPSTLEDGSVIVEKWYNEGVFDENGTIQYYYCIAKLNSPPSGESSVSLKDNDLISNRLIKSNLLGIIIAIDTNILFVNQRTYEIFGIKPLESVEKVTLKEFIGSILPGANKIIDESDENDASSFELLIQHPDGKDHWISIIRKFQLHNGVNTAMFLIEDITARKANEIEIQKVRSNLSDVMQIAKIGYWEKDFRNSCWLWSNEIYNIFEIPNGTTITEDILSDYLDSESMAIRQNQMAKAFSAKQRSYSYSIEYRITLPGGCTKWLSCESFFLKDENGNQDRFYGWVQDITDRKLIEENLRRAKEKAEESERLKTAFLANMSHEIRTPLNAILGFSDLLTRTASETEQDKFRKIINQSSKLLLKIIDDILDISTIESSSLDLQFETIDVSDFLESITDIFSEYQNSEIKLIIQKPEPAITVRADRERLKQVLINLITNAYKYTEKGRITVSGFEKNNSITFTVKDTGVGIDHKVIDTIFERFYQVDSFSKGTGLGLAISRSIVEQMGGEIRAESVAGKGSCFTVTLRPASIK